MSPFGPTPPRDEPVCLELELVRAEAADDAFAFRFARQTYLIRGRQGAYETAELPWSRELLRDLDEIRRPDRDPATVARVGDMLRELLGPAGWASHEAAIVDARAARRRVHLTLRSAAAELYALPWELLTLRADGQHVGALGHVLLRYAWPGTSTVAAGPRPGTRVLVAWSAAGGGVPAAEQIGAIERAAEASGRPDALEVLAHASYGAIADALDRALGAGEPFAALHLLCHGAEAGSTFGLALDGEGDGRPAVVDASRLQQLVAPYAEHLRLVVVSACDGGNMGEPGNHIGSVAQRLHRAGLEYVIASRYPLSAKGSTRIAGALYQALLGGAPVEEAFVDARTAASREVTQLDWASLQLYARPEDGNAGRVLATAAPTPEPAPAPQPAPAQPTAAPAPASPPRRARWLPAVLVGLAAMGGLTALAFTLHDDAPTPRATATVPAPEPREPAPEPAPREPEPEPREPEPVDGGATGTTTPAADDGTADDTSPAPAPAPEPAPAGDEGSTPRSHPTKVKPKLPASSPSLRPTSACSTGIKDQIRDALGSSGSGVYKVRVWALAGGGLTILECRECGDRAALANERTSRAKVRTYGDEQALPCKTTIDWQP